MSDLISIIIPVYNVEKYLEKCLDSVINQTHKNLDIILVDDGSTDNSGKICDTYAKQDSRIKVIHKENGGLSSARNEGIKVASGSYIGFVDSDDYIDLDMYEVLYNLIKENNADISMVSFYEENNDIILRANNSQKLYIYNRLDAIKELLFDKIIQSNVWSKLFSKQLFDTIQFPNGKNYEDIATTILLFEKANILVFWEIPKYHYIRRANSICGKLNIKTCIDLLNIIYERFFYIKNKYPELNIYNAFAYTLFMIWSYSDTVFYNSDDIRFNEYMSYYDRNYQVLLDIINTYEKDIIQFFTLYQKAILYTILFDKDNCKSEIKKIYIKNKNRSDLYE